MASSRGSTASSKPPKQRLAVTAQSATSKPWFTCSQPNSISCFQTEIVATHAKQRRTNKLDASDRHLPGYGEMDVLIVERDELIAAVLSDALSADGISVAVVPSEEEAMRTCRDGSPRVVITGINRRSEDMKGLYFARAMRVRCPWLAVVFMAALWPVRLHQCA